MKNVSCEDTRVDVAAFAAHTRAILDPDTSLGAVYQHCHALHDIYVSVTGLHARDEARPEMMQETRLRCGRAISIKNAAHCLLEFRRTAAYLRGIHAAIQDLHQRNPDQPIHMVYAGCGPYATLITPLLPLLTDIPLKLTLIDIHQTSLDMVASVFEALGFPVPELVQGDAATYQHPSDQTMDLVVTETMRRTLEGETQVAILANFVRQMKQDAVLIPESVTLTASCHWFRYFEDETPPDTIHHDLDWRLHVDRDWVAAVDLADHSETHDIQMPCDPITLPVADLKRHRLGIHTLIRTYGDHVLTDKACSLNQVIHLYERDFDSVQSPLTCRYYVTGAPGLHIEGLKRDRV